MAPFAEQMFQFGADLARAKAEELKAEREPTLQELTKDWERNTRANNARIDKIVGRLRRERGLL